MFLFLNACSLFTTLSEFCKHPQIQIIRNVGSIILCRYITTDLPGFCCIIVILWLVVNTNLGSSFVCWAMGIGPGLVMVVMVGAGIMSVDIVNIVSWGGFTIQNHSTKNQLQEQQNCVQTNLCTAKHGE